MRSILYILIAAVFAISGCAASVGVGGGYSILDTIPPPEGPIVMSQGVRPVVAVGPIGVPGYIMRARAIVDSTVSMANISTFDQRAALLEREIPRVITVNLANLLRPRGMTVMTSGLGTDPDYRIAVDLSSFGVDSFNRLETKGRYALYVRGSQTPALVRDVAYTGPATDGSDYAVRGAMSRSLADLSTAIVKDFEGILVAR